MLHTCLALGPSTSGLCQSFSRRELQRYPLRASRWWCCPKAGNTFNVQTDESIFDRFLCVQGLMFYLLAVRSPPRTSACWCAR